MNEIDPLFVTDRMPPLMRAVLGWLQGQPVLTTLLIMMFVDVVSGAAAAFIQKKLSSSISFKGAVKKGLALLMIGVGVVLEPYSGGLPLSKLTCLFFLYHEVLSVVENMAEAGVPIPQAIVETLAKLRMESNKNIQVGTTSVTTTMTTTQPVSTVSNVPIVAVEIKPVDVPPPPPQA